MEALFLIGFVLSATCAFVSAFMLFRLKTIWTIITGIMLFIWNGCISAFCFLSWIMFGHSW
jgi:hypothetical protein